MLVDVLEADRVSGNHSVVRIGDPFSAEFDQIQVKGEEARLNWVREQANVLLKKARGSLQNSAFKKLVPLILQEEREEVRAHNEPDRRF